MADAPSDTVIVTIIGAIGAALVSILSFLAGQRKQRYDEVGALVVNWKNELERMRAERDAYSKRASEAEARLDALEDQARLERERCAKLEMRLSELEKK